MFLALKMDTLTAFKYVGRAKSVGLMQTPINLKVTAASPTQQDL